MIIKQFYETLLWVLVLDYACQMSKNIVLKNKDNRQLILFAHKEKKSPRNY